MLGTVALATATPNIPGWLKVFQSMEGASVSLLIILVLSVGFGLWVSRSARMEDAWWRYGLILGSLLLGLLCIANKWPPKLGVDLKGGAIFIGQFKEATDKSAVTGNEQSNRERFIQRLKQRIDPTGTREIVIRLLGKNQVEVIIPAADGTEAERLWKRMTTVGHLQFRMLAIESAVRGGQAMDAARRQGELEDEFARRDRIVRGGKLDEKTGEKRIVARWYNIARMDDGQKGNEEGKPKSYRYLPSTRTALLRDGTTGRLVTIDQLRSGSAPTDDPEIQLQNVTRNAEALGITNLQILLTEPGEKSRVDGEHLRNVSPDREGFEPVVRFLTNTKGTSRLARLTSSHKKKGNTFNFMAIVLDGEVMSAPSIDTPITQGQGIIRGGFTKESVNDLVVILNSGKTNLALKKDYDSMETIQSSLGEEMKQQGVYAIAISLLVVLVFMAIYYYQYAGIIACFALVMNMILVAAALVLLGQPITLTGLAGFVLTVGMSVDANVLVFERIREEIDKGTSIRLAIRNGFDRATTTIIDANVTTLLTAVVLYVIGSEQIKSFAIVLILGILTSMFTAIFVSRSIFDVLERKRMIKSLKMMKIFSAHKLPVINFSKIALTISSILIIIGLVATVGRGAGIFDYDLRGGSTASVVFNAETNREDIADKLGGLDVKMGKEKVSFYVSPLESEIYQANTYFKIESTLKGIEDAKSEDGTVPEDYRSLKQILQDTFGEKLIRLNVEAGKISVEGEEPETKTSLIQPSFHPIYASTGSIFQEKAGQEKKEEAKTESEEKSKQDAEKATSDIPVKEKADTEKPAETKSSTEQKSDDKPAALQPSNPVDTGEQEKETTPRSKLKKVSVDFKFSVVVLEGTVKGQLLEAAQEIDVDLQEDLITVKSENGSNKDTKFKATMILANVNDAQRIVDAMTQKLDSEPFFPRISSVGGQIAGAGQQKAILALIISLIGIILYIWFRFQHIWFGFAAVAALVHDVLFVIGAIALSFWLSSFLGFIKIDSFKISLQVVGALLTVVGYSLNDTIVVFDRIREVRGRSNKFNGDMIDVSIGQTLSRTILTSFTTFMVVFILFGWGGESIHAFAFALVVGVIVGTFSSVFVASPVLLWLMNFKPIAIEPLETEENAKS